MRRVVSPLRGEARPRKRFCPPRTRSPHLNLSQPPFEAWCADPIHPHFHSGWQLGDAFVFPPFAARPLAAGEPHVRRHSCFSPAVYGTRAGHPSAQHFSLRHPEQGRRGLSFTLEGAAASRPSRHPISGMSSLARHYDSSVTLPSRMGAFTRGIVVGSPHNSNRLHSSVWEKSPPFRRGSPDSSKQRRQGFCSTTGTFLPPAERSNRGSTAVGSRTRFLQPLLPRSKEGRRLEAYPGSTAFESFPLQREVQNADDENHHVSGSGGRLVCHHRPEGCVFSHPGRSQTQEIPSVRLWREGLPIQGSALRPGFGPEDIYQMHGCCTGPFEAPGHPCTELSGRLAHSGSLQGASESSQGYRSRPHPFSWPQNERQEECAPPISTNCISRSSFGFRSDAGPFGSCPDTSFYSMFGPLQARPSCLCRYLPQAVGPYGSSLPCVAPRAASHEAIPLVDEGAEVTPHCTSYSPYQGVAQLLSTPVNVARPRLSPERGENGCDPPSPYDHDGRINDRLGRGLRRKAGEWRVEGRLSSLLQKGAIEEVPQSEVERGFFSRYFLVPKRDGGLRPILDLRRLNLSLYKGKFKMLTMRTIMSQVQEGDWFVTIDLKDAYFHIQVVHRHRRFLRFAFGGKAYQYKVLPFGLALAPRTFTKCMDAALAPLRLQGIRVLNYLDDWLILAHSRELVSRHRDIVLGHIHSLGLRMNAKKSVLLPSLRTVFLGVRLDSVQMQARLAPARIPVFTACLARFKLDHHVSVGTCRRLLGLMAAASLCCP